LLKEGREGIWEVVDIRKKELGHVEEKGGQGLREQGQCITKNTKREEGAKECFPMII